MSRGAVKPRKRPPGDVRKLARAFLVDGTELVDSDHVGEDIDTASDRPGFLSLWWAPRSSGGIWAVRNDGDGAFHCVYPASAVLRVDFPTREP